MKILVIGDFHSKLPAKLKNIITKEKLDLIISVGDYSGAEDWRPYILHAMRNKESSMREGPEEFFGKKKFAELMKKDFREGEEAIEFLDKQKIPFISIFGNADEEWFNYPFGEGIWELSKERGTCLEGLKNFKDITYGILNHKKISILGLGGYIDVEENHSMEDRLSPEYLTVLSRLKKTQRMLSSLIKKIKHKNKFFVFHYPIKGIFDIVNEKGNHCNGISAGLDFFRDAVLKEKPALVLCGHMHEYQGAEMLGKSLIVNPGAACDGKCAFVNFDEIEGRVKNVKFIK